MNKREDHEIQAEPSQTHGPSCVAVTSFLGQPAKIANRHITNDQVTVNQCRRTSQSFERPLTGAQPDEEASDEKAHDGSLK